MAPPVNPKSEGTESASKYVERLIKENKIVIFSRTTCPWCDKVKELFDSLKQSYVTVELDVVDNGDDIKSYLISKTKQKTVPNVFVSGTWVGGHDDTVSAKKKGTLAKLIAESKSQSEDSASSAKRRKTDETIEAYVDRLIKSNSILIFTTTTCPWCKKVKELFDSLSEKYVSVELDILEDGAEVRKHLAERTKQTSVPNVFINGTHVGGYDNTSKAHKDGRLTTLIHSTANSQQDGVQEKMTKIPARNEGELMESYVDRLIKLGDIVVFTTTTCPWCKKVRELFDSLGEGYINVELDVVPEGTEIRKVLADRTKKTSVPKVYIHGEHLGGHDDTVQANKEGRLSVLIHPPSTTSKSEDAKSLIKPKPGQAIDAFVNDLIDTNKIVIFSKTTCPYCVKVKELFDSLNEPYVSVELDKIEEGADLRDHLFTRTGQKTVPNVYINRTHMGGCESVLSASKEGRLEKILSSSTASIVRMSHDDLMYDYDLVVIGGGSGGLACSKEAVSLGAKVAVLDFVKPTPIGTTWGLGGTCVNVGCIPKKLMHQSALLGEALHESKEFGWQTPDDIKHSWQTMRDNIQSYIGSLNWNYRVQLRDKKVEYINAYGEFVDQHKLLLTYKNNKTKEITAKNIVVAVGGRPKYPDDLKGGLEHCITSDDLFSLNYNPGKTLCVGASYVSLECAGFLRGLGLDVTVMVRSILLRGFDQQMANLIGDYMEKTAGVHFIRGSVPVEIVRISEGEPGELLVKYKDENNEIKEEMFNTVLLAVGREPCTRELKVADVGVKLNARNGKILTSFEQSNVEHIYAVGDVIDEKSAAGRMLELTPVAIKAGQLLARRLFGKSDVKMDYYAVPTTVFTPIEYGSIGYSEEEALETFGEENIEVYHTTFWPLEWTVAHKQHDICYAKLICNKADKERVVGLHVAGPNAGEITQGYAVAIKMRATKMDFDMTVGIHPTCSEVFTTLSVTKSSGKEAGGKGC